VSEVPEADQRDGDKPGGTAASVLDRAAIKIVDEQGRCLLGHRRSVYVIEPIITLGRPFAHCIALEARGYSQLFNIVSPGPASPW
jgi:hypothetical protein